MSDATAAPRRTNDEPSAKRRRFQILKATGASLLLLVLAYAGFRGRQYARLQVKLGDITTVRDQLQQKLDEEKKPAHPLASGVANGDSNRSPSASLQIVPLAKDLQTRLEQFDGEYRTGRLSGAEGLEIRLAKATAANAEQRFADALATITADDEKKQRTNTDAQVRLIVRVLKIRADSFYGEQKWQEALDRYQQMLTLKPDDVATLGPMADCQHALGRTNEAWTAYRELAKSHNNRGDDALVRGKTDLAIGHYGKAIEIQTRLLDRSGRTEIAIELTKSYNNRGNALLAQGKMDAAIGDLEKAFTLAMGLIKQDGQSEFDLAASHSNWGNALFGQRKFGAAIDHYSKAIEIQTRLTEQEKNRELASDLAITHNNRGVVHRAQGKLDAAIADFDTAIKIQTAITERTEPITTQTNRVRTAQGKLALILGYSEREVDVQTLPQLAEQVGQRERAIALAIILQNRGYACLAQRKPDAAVPDFKRAMQIYARLVEQGSSNDSSVQSAMSELRSRLELSPSRNPTRASLPEAR